MPACADFSLNLCWALEPMQKEVSTAGGASSQAAAAAGADGAGAGQGIDYADEPTLPEDLEDEDIPALRPAAAPSAAR